MGFGNSAKQNIAVLFGGRSVEHEISIITGLQLIGEMDTIRYNPIPVYIANDGKWYTGDELLTREFYVQALLSESLMKLTEVTLLPKPGVGGLTILSSPQSKGIRLFGGKKEPDVIPVDVFIPALHGSYGEDGCLQGLFEMAGVPYAGCNVVSAAVGMNKWMCKRLVSTGGVPVLPDTVVSRDEARSNIVEARNKILQTDGLGKFPLFVKPCSLGSSVGIMPADDAVSLDAALANVFKYDLHAIVEPKISNIGEINVSVLGGNPSIASVVEMPKSQTGVLTYEEKYMREGGSKKTPSSQGMASLTRDIDPKHLDSESKSAAQDYAIRAFDLLGCSGVARIDFILDKDTNKLYFNEINTLPGSMAFYLWKETKPPILYTELITRVINDAIVRKQAKDASQSIMGFRALKK